MSKVLQKLNFVVVLATVSGCGRPNDSRLESVEVAGAAREQGLIRVTNLARGAPGYASFSSHRPAFANGLASYLERLDDSALCGDRGEPVLAAWKVSGLNSSDEVAAQGAACSRAPALIPAGESSVLAFFSNGFEGDAGAKMLRIDRQRDKWKVAKTSVIKNGGGGKFTALADPFRDNRFYYMTHVTGTIGLPAPNFFVVDRDGKELEKPIAMHIASGSKGNTRVQQYPVLAACGSTLFAAWTISTDDPAQAKHPYIGARLIESEDGGRTWRSPHSKKPLTLPVNVDTAGVRLDVADKDIDSWLANLTCDDKYVYAIYGTKAGTRFSRLDRKRAVLDIQSQELSAAGVKLGGQSALAVRDSRFPGRFYAIGIADSRSIAVLRSDDSGKNWQLAARSEVVPPGFELYSLSGSNAVYRGGPLNAMVTALDRAAGDRSRASFLSNVHNVLAINIGLEGP